MQALTFVFAFVAVLALIGVAAWLVRRFAGDRLNTNTKSGRMPRLAVIDAAAVDGRRRLVLVRRDNVEHLLMIGGPSDIVIEPNIVRAASARAGAEPPRIPSPDALGWSDEPIRPEELDAPDDVLSEPRPNRPSFLEESRRSMPTLPERRPSELTPFQIPDALNRPDPRPLEPSRPRGETSPPSPSPLTPPSPARAPRLGETTPRPPAARAPERGATPTPPASPITSTKSADENLAEMAQRLEAALRRPGAGPDTVGAPPVAPDPPSTRPSREAPAASTAPPATPVAGPGKPAASFENLEDEMASLLGRPKTLREAGKEPA